MGSTWDRIKAGLHYQPAYDELADDQEPTAAEPAPPAAPAAAPAAIPPTHDGGYQVTAHPHRDGWQLTVAGVGTTQSRTLEGTWDSISALIVDHTGEDEAGIWWDLKVDLPGLEDEIKAARSAVAHAEHQRHQAAGILRAVAVRMRRDGLSVADAAWLLEVSRSRISQLTASDANTRQ